MPLVQEAMYAGALALELDDKLRINEIASLFVTLSEETNKETEDTTARITANVFILVEV